MKIKETRQLLLQPETKRSLSKIAQNCSILLILDKYQKDILTLIGMGYESMKNAHLQRHLRASFISLNELGRVSN